LDEPALTVAVLDRHLRGYPEDCLRSLGADGRRGAEFLLVTGREASLRLRDRFPGLNVIRLEGGDRATAKNAALERARGERILLVSADTIAAEGTVDRLLEFLDSRPRAAASAQLLCENGLPRRTAYPFPTLLHELDPTGRLRHALRRALLKRRPQRATQPWPAQALRAAFLMAHRDVFQEVGGFAEGYRFGYEDVEWCLRAERRGIPRFVIPGARAFHLAPQLRGPVPPAARCAMEASLWRLVEDVFGPARARAYIAVRRWKALWTWTVCAVLDYLLDGRSALLSYGRAAHRQIWRAEPGSAADAPQDVESHVRWEYVV